MCSNSIGWSHKRGVLHIHSQYHGLGYRCAIMHRRYILIYNWIVLHWVPMGGVYVIRCIGLPVVTNCYSDAEGHINGLPLSFYFRSSGAVLAPFSVCFPIIVYDLNLVRKRLPHQKAFIPVLCLM